MNCQFKLKTLLQLNFYFDFLLCLDFYDNKNLCDDHIFLLSEVISKNQNLKKIDIELGWNQYISQQSINFISSCLLDKQSLKYLSLSFHYLKKIESINNLNQSLFNLVNLQNFSLTLGGCSKLNNNEINQLFLLIQNMKQLQELYLDVYCCHISDELVNILGDSLQKCQCIKKLNLNLGSNSQIINIQSLGMVIHLSQLIELQFNLNNCFNLSQGPFGCCSQNIINIEKFSVNLDQCKSVAINSLKQFTSDLKFLVNLKELNLLQDLQIYTKLKKIVFKN
ncbi:hypothetical protein TTHERM_00200560 (macronuclear) [Tetrahymena thermophila SB210]|uniref:Kinase domain protein n=1 Tax=Tetrahymena thermophila (strain SB210) TaxID=312017 RepID=Q22NJ1_TETTS|nr:hypothetical protein TTHERM_00200560 [Tetrahymena thermophila SB210]EAR86794.2 hypothetical protein TTHERM_00200560 [Tetrahymena thermophila SB210]|eukprot:XP_001007039.2 hypothetical protein TTHERM_00200560 [Tetrahymena thermophila SB210]